MAKRRGRRAVKQKEVTSETATEKVNLGEEKDDAFEDQEVERQVAAIRALRDVEIEQLRTMVQLLRSCFTEEQAKVPVLQFSKEKLPNLSIVKNEQTGHFEVKLKDEQRSLFMDQAGGGNINASLMHGLSMLYNVKSSLFGAETPQNPSFNLEEPSASRVLELQDKFRTPNVNNQRTSFGMTPTTLRLPKPGEVLLSAHGSPLGVYKKDNMEAINEVEDA